MRRVVADGFILADTTLQQ